MAPRGAQRPCGAAMNARRWRCSLRFKATSLLPAAPLLPATQHSFFLPVSHFLPVTLPRTSAMAHKGDSGSGGFVRPTKFTEAEARILWENTILVPPAWHLPHGWNVSEAGYAAPPVLEGAELKALIGHRWQMLPMHEQELPENAPHCSGSGRPSLASSPGPTPVGTTSSAGMPGGRTGMSTTCSRSTATCRPRRAAQLPTHDRCRRR
jgi:hypothetical protein